VSGDSPPQDKRVVVSLPASGIDARSSYEVIVGSGVTSVLARELSSVLPGARRAAVVTQRGIGAGVDAGISQMTFVIEPGEQAKKMSTVEELCRGFVDFGLNRHDVVVAVGGGVVSDVAGFAASCYHRGVALVNVPTSLLAQVDAAVGGKTGVNLPEGKNLVGAFWQPALVLADTDLLESLPEREWLSGMGEVAKYCFLGAGDLRGLATPEMVARCVAVKAEVVSSDQHESYRRMILNYGHTFGHAIEAAGLASAGEASITHGEAVAIGLVFAAKLALRLGRISEDRVRYHEELISGLGLPTRPVKVSTTRELLSFMLRDKKSSEGLTFVLDGPSGVEPLAGVAERDVLAVMAEMGCGS
jgi:5-deoxy-5-amino-3-dehydroquinate synthase